MNWKHLWWIVPLCLIIGYLLGLYFNLPQTLTIDISEDMERTIDKLSDMESIKINHTDCPNCTCDCQQEASEWLWNLYADEYWQSFDTDQRLYFIERSLIRIENGTERCNI